MKKCILTMLLFVLSACCFAQNPVYNSVAGTVSWTINIDTTQQMLGCPGNNYNAEGQCESGL